MLSAEAAWEAWARDSRHRAATHAGRVARWAHRHPRFDPNRVWADTLVAAGHPRTIAEIAAGLAHGWVGTLEQLLDAARHLEQSR